MQRFELLLALRYLRSQRGERFASLVGWSSAVGMAIGVMTLIVVMSVMNGVATEIRDKILGFSSHVEIQGSGDTFANWNDWLDIAKKLPHVEQALPYISTQTLANHRHRSTGAILKGIDIQHDITIAAFITKGSFLKQPIVNKHLFEAVIGKDLAHKLSVSVGDNIRLLSPSSGISPMGASPRMRAFKVVGIFDSGFYEYDVGLILTSMQAVQRLSRLGNEITGIELHLTNRDQATQVANIARTNLPPSAWVTSWQQRHKSFFQALKMERTAMGIILFLIIVVAIFNMVSSLVMVVMEKRKEVAILKTIGASHASIIRIFLLMGIILSSIGTLTGLLAGVVLSLNLEAIIAWIEKVSHTTFLSGDVYYIDHVPAILDTGSVMMVAVASLCMGILATLYPAWRAAQIPPAEALRYE
ncbi:MAG TPA: lipoprotein-releasing ABC transporter permease subunit [Ghiorsea sp.]|nr:lipoprotein-releasing ABC transporter permease subunit [Ghiorsea sp.]HIP07765.1 lipoprotein-releasing ABC transporter permease subunit [Mariprofundaceae bacterium]